jgi:hypothetical protein
LVKEWEKQQVRREQAVMAGKRSGEVRKGTTVERPLNGRVASLNPSSSSSSSSSEVQKGVESARQRRGSKEEISSYCKEQGLTAQDSEWLWAKWQENDFTRDGKPIKDWRGTIRTWKLTGYIFPSHKNGNSNTNGRRPHIELTEKQRLAISRGELKDPNYE